MVQLPEVTVGLSTRVQTVVPESPPSAECASAPNVITFVADDEDAVPGTAVAPLAVVVVEV